MGIDADRFSGDAHEPFLCAVCLDVVDDPIMTPCDHLFCKACFSHGQCPSCRETVQQVKPLNRVLKQIYDSLKLKCSERRCQEVLNVSNFKTHDKSCPKRFFDCSKCGCKLALSTLVASRNHDSVEYLKDKLIATKLECEDKVKILAKEEPKRVKCGIVIKRGETYYKCRTCALNPSVCLCADCFKNGDHSGHDYVTSSESSYGGFCDCGDKSYLRKGNVYCKKHKHESHSYFNYCD